MRLPEIDHCSVGEQFVSINNMSEEPDDGPPVPQHSDVPTGTEYFQDPLIPFERTEWRDLSDADYAEWKAGQGKYGDSEQYDAKMAEAAEVNARLIAEMRLGITATGKAVSVELVPTTMSRGDIDVRNTKTWSQLCEIEDLINRLNSANAKITLKESVTSQMLRPLTKGEDSINPDVIGKVFIGPPESKGRREREKVFADSINLLQHGTEEQRLSMIDNLRLRLAIALGEPNPVEIAKQLIFQGMPLLPGEDYGYEEEKPSKKAGKAKQPARKQNQN